MPASVKLREDFSADQLRALARRSKDVNQSRRLLSLAAVRDGKDRGDAAKIGGMDRQTLRDWVHRFNAAGPEGLFDHWSDGPEPRLSAEQLAEFARSSKRGRTRDVDGVVRWRRVDLQRVITESFGVDYHERYVGTLLKPSASPMSAQARATPAQNGEIVEAYKKTSRDDEGASRRCCARRSDRNLVPDAMQADCWQTEAVRFIATELFSCRRTTPLVLSSILPLNSAHRPGLSRVGSQ